MPQPAQPPIAEPGQIDIISPSIIALGEPAVTNENVAAIDGETKKTGPSTTPMVIRGGMVGDAFSAPTGAVRSQCSRRPPRKSAFIGERGRSPDSEPSAPEPPAPAEPAIKPE